MYFKIFYLSKVRLKYPFGRFYSMHWNSQGFDEILHNVLENDANIFLIVYFISFTICFDCYQQIIIRYNILSIQSYILISLIGFVDYSILCLIVLNLKVYFKIILFFYFRFSFVLLFIDLLIMLQLFRVHGKFPLKSNLFRGLNNVLIFKLIILYLF